jgi:Tfp pilus assembly major pilin PilA
MEGSEKLVTALTDISNSNKEMESRKIDLQKEIHAANLDYKRERDRTVAENTMITLLHQSAVVTTISNLAEALGRLNQ